MMEEKEARRRQKTTSDTTFQNLLDSLEKMHGPHDEYDHQKLVSFLKDYSLVDLLQSFFVIDLWLPNIASPIKMQYLYTIVESIHGELLEENQIKTYGEFVNFCKNLYSLLPGFPVLEDYVPEADWAEIKYFSNKRFYKIFYGGDLSNSYDFYYSFELVHKVFTEHYLEITSRSPQTELDFCLGEQDYILNNLKQERSPTQENVVPGHIEVPQEDFWSDTIKFLGTYQYNSYSPDIISLYGNELEDSKVIPDLETFVDNAYSGKNSNYFFIRKGEKIYPVMPRKWLTVLYDKWGRLLIDSYDEIQKRIKTANPGILIGIRLAHFMGDRIEEDNVLSFVAPLKSDKNPPHDIRYTAIRSGDNLLLVYTCPPMLDQEQLSKHLEEIAPKLKESAELARVAPTQLGQFAKQRIVEFRSKDGKTLEPKFIIAIPTVLTDTQGSVKIPRDVDAEIMTLDQVAGLFDEIENPDELSDFFAYVESERARQRFAPMNSYLDLFGSFKDSSGVLIPGAMEPDLISLDFNWGSSYRFKSLKRFWSSYPEEGLFGHPRSWSVPESRITKTGLLLSSKSFFGYAYVQKIGESIFHINSPVHKMDIHQGGTADTLMHSLFDAIDLYPEIISKLEITKSHNKIQFFFCPTDLASSDPELSHVKHLSQEQEVWLMDSGRLRASDYGVRTIYNKEIVVEAMKDIKDRSFQIQLLIDVLTKLAEVHPEPSLKEIVAELESKKSEKPRFGMFAVEKRASYPQYSKTIMPGDREFKLADKEIAKIAHGLGIEPGTYSSDVAQEKLNALRKKVVSLLDEKIKRYDFSLSLPMLFAKSNAHINDAWQIEAELKATRGHDLDYASWEKSSEKEKEFLHWYRVYRYLIEKFTQHQPSSRLELDLNGLKEILALADRLMDLYVSSDFINYEIFPVDVDIDRDYIVSSRDGTHDISAMEKEYGEEQAKINLGVIGNNNDTADSNIPVEEYLNDLDSAFKTDLGFGLKNLVNVQQVLALWAEKAGVEETTNYSATLSEITKVCKTEITGFDESETEPILDFLTLKQQDLLTIKDDPNPTEDLPVWEHNKRLMRFDIRPLIKIKNNYHWAPHSIERSSRIWIGISSKHRLPSDIDTPTIKSVLDRGHKNLEENLVEKTKEVVARFTADVKTDIFPHKLDSTISDIGDYDVIAYLSGPNVLLNIESKIIDPPHSNKDSGRVQRKIFGENKSDGTFKKGYLQKVEERAAYLQSNGVELMKKLGWSPPTTPPKVISVFVTKIGFWWTKHPPIKTDVEFVEIRLLEDFLKEVK